MIDVYLLAMFLRDEIRNSFSTASMLWQFLYSQHLLLCQKSMVSKQRSLMDQCDLKTMLWPIRLQKILVAIMLKSAAIAIAALQNWTVQVVPYIHCWKHMGGD